MADNKEPTAEESAANMIAAAANLKKMGPAFEEAQAQISLMYFRRYNTLVKAGFSESQALAIIASRGLS